MSISVDLRRHAERVLTGTGLSVEDVADAVEPPDVAEVSTAAEAALRDGWAAARPDAQAVQS